MSLPALRGRLNGGEPDLNPTGPAGRPKKKDKALSRGSSNRDAYVQETFVDASPRLSSLFKRFTLSSPEKIGQGSQGAAGDLQFVGTWTHQPSRPSVVARAKGQDVSLGGDAVLFKQCPYPHRSRDPEPINDILCRRSLHGATAPICTCKGNYGIYSTSLRVGRTRLSALDAAKSSRSQPRIDHYGDFDGDYLPRSRYDRHRQRGLSMADSNSYTVGSSPKLDATATSPLVHSVTIAGRGYSKTQSPREPPPACGSSSFPASAAGSAAPSSPEQALTPFASSVSPDNYRKRDRQDSSPSPSRGRNPPRSDRSSNSKKILCIHYQRDPVKYRTCENRRFPGFKTLKAHVFEHVRRFQCGRCGMRAGKEDNLKKHQRNYARRCKVRDRRAPTITREEEERFVAIEEADEQQDLEEAVFSPAALFEKDSAMGARGPASSETPPMRSEIAQPSALQNPPPIQQAPSQMETDTDIAMRTMRSELALLKTALQERAIQIEAAAQERTIRLEAAVQERTIRLEAVVQEQAKKIDLLMFKLDNSNQTTTAPLLRQPPSSVRDAQNLLAPSSSSAPDSLVGRLQQEVGREARVRELEYDRDARVRELEHEIRILRGQQREEREWPADDEPPPGIQGSAEAVRLPRPCSPVPYPFSLPLGGEEEGLEDINFGEYIYDSLLGGSEGG